MGNIRVPLTFTGVLTGGQPSLRTPLVYDESVTGGNPEIRSNFVYSEPLTGGNPHLRQNFTFVESLIPVPEELPVATYVFPKTRSGVKWDRQKVPSGNNARRVMTSGRRSVTPFMLYPRWNFVLDFEVLPDTRYVSGLSAKLSSVQDIVDLYKNTLFGAFTFLYSDPDDYHIVGGTIASADGVTLQWPFVAPVMGTVLEPIGQLDLSTLLTFASSAVDTTTDEITISGHGFTTGQSPPMFVANSATLPTPLTTNTPYWPVVVDANHIRLATTLPKALAGDYIDITAVGSGTNTLSKGWAAYLTITESHTVPGVGPYTVTVGNASAFVNDNNVTIGGVALTKVTGAPAANQYSVDITTGVYTFNSAQASATAVIEYTYFSSATLTLPNQLVFGVAPTNNALITADFDYYFVCRFDDDKMELNEFSKQLYELQKLNFSSEVG